MDSQLGMAQLILAELPPAIWYSAFTGRAENIRFPFLREICFSSCSLSFFFKSVFFFFPKTFVNEGAAFQELISFEEMSRQVDMKGEAWQCLEGYPFLAGGVGCGS